METNHQGPALPTSIPNTKNRQLPGYTGIAKRITGASQPGPAPGQVTPTAEPEVLVSPTITSFTYKHLEEFHLERIKLNEDGSGRPAGVLRNHRSVLRGWASFITSPESGRATAGSPTAQDNWAGSFFLVGEELTVRFAECLTQYLTSLEVRGLSPNTRNDRKSILRSIRESWNELAKINGLPVDFVDALKWLIDRSGYSLGTVARLSGLGSLIYYWLRGSIPSSASLAHIKGLEDFFKIPQGTLSSRLPDVVWLCPDGPFKTCTTK